MGALVILKRFNGVDAAEPSNVGKVWSAVEDIDNPQSVDRQGKYKLGVTYSGLCANYYWLLKFCMVRLCAIELCDVELCGLCLP